LPQYSIAISNMKNKTGWKQPIFQSSLSVCLALVAGALVLAGCSKAKKTAAEAPAPSAQELKQAENDHMPAPSPTAPVALAPLATPTGQPDMGELNRTLIRWIVGHRRPPANFAEFAATAGVAIPPPPAGQKYIIAKNMHIQLVSQ
jgi:hypothetical protein